MTNRITENISVQEKNHFSQGPTPLLLISGIIFIIYAPVVQNEFLYWDDYSLIVENFLVSRPGLHSFWQFWTSPFQTLYAPMTHSFWALESLVFGVQPFVFHAANLILHIFNSLMVYLLIRELFKSQSSLTAGMGALVFALHPLQLETVAWASATKDLLYTAFSLISAKFYISSLAHIEPQGKAQRRLKPQKGLQKDRQNFDILSLGFFIAALLSKPTAVILPFILILFNRFFLKTSWRKSTYNLIPWIILSFIFSVLTRITQPEITEPGNAISFWIRPLVAIDTASFYLKKLILPFPLSTDYGRTPEWILSSGAIKTSWLPIFCVLLVSILLVRRLPWVIGSLGVFILGFLPVSGLITFDFQHYSTVSDHYLYFSLLGAALLFSQIVHLTSNSKLQKSALVLPAALGVLTCSQAKYWRDNTSLFNHVLEVNPRSFMAHDNLGQELEKQNQLEKALEHYKRAIQINPHHLSSLNNFGNTLYNLGRYDEAITHLSPIVSNIPDGSPQENLYIAQMNNNFGAALFRKNRYQEGIERFKAAIRIYPSFLDPYLNLGNIYASAGDKPQAIEMLRHAHALDPQHPQVISALRSLGVLN